MFKILQRRKGKELFLKVFIWTQLIFWFFILLRVDSFHFQQDISLDVNGTSETSETSDSSDSGVKDYKFKHFSLQHWENQRYQLQTDNRTYFKTVGKYQCYINGTDFTRSVEVCVCVQGYYGKYCGIPQSAWFSHFRNSPDVHDLRPRAVPRRLVHGLQVNHEHDLFYARMHALDGIVDAYLLLESNYSAYGTGKPLRFLERFQSGWLENFQDKIMYVFLSFFPKEGETNGWYADSFLRFFLGKNGMKMIENTREDDIFLLLDADELPTKEALIFLKLFDGWREPVKFGFRWTVFGFFWLKAEDPGQLESIPLIGKLFSRKKQERLLTLYTVCTLGMLSKVYGDNAMLLRRNVWNNTLLHDRLNNYTANHPKIQEWTLGNIGHYAGHHCSWCYSPEGIRLKLEAAQRHDKPRWGDYPDKLNLKYIQELIRTGGWFDGSKPFISVPRTKNDTGLFAPDYILNSNLFQYLVKPPS